MCLRPLMPPPSPPLRLFPSSPHPVSASAALLLNFAPPRKRSNPHPFLPPRQGGGGGPPPAPPALPAGPDYGRRTPGGHACYAFPIVHPRRAQTAQNIRRTSRRKLLKVGRTKAPAAEPNSMPILVAADGGSATLAGSPWRSNRRTRSRPRTYFRSPRIQRSSKRPATRSRTPFRSRRSRTLGARGRSRALGELGAARVGGP